MEKLSKHNYVFVIIFVAILAASLIIYFSGNFQLQSIDQNFSYRYFGADTEKIVNISVTSHEETLKVMPIDPNYEVVLLTFIPKALASNISEVKISTNGKLRIINEDPLLAIESQNSKKSIEVNYVFSNTKNISTINVFLPRKFMDGLTRNDLNEISTQLLKLDYSDANLTVEQAAKLEKQLNENLSDLFADSIVELQLPEQNNQAIYFSDVQGPQSGVELPQLPNPVVDPSQVASVIGQTIQASSPQSITYEEITIISAPDPRAALLSKYSKNFPKKIALTFSEKIPGSIYRTNLIYPDIAYAVVGVPLSNVSAPKVEINGELAAYITPSITGNKEPYKLELKINPSLDPEKFNALFKGGAYKKETMLKLVYQDIFPAKTIEVPIVIYNDPCKPAIEDTGDYIQATMSTADCYFALATVSANQYEADYSKARSEAETILDNYIKANSLVFLDPTLALDYLGVSDFQNPDDLSAQASTKTYIDRYDPKLLSASGYSAKMDTAEKGFAKISNYYDIQQALYSALRDYAKTQNDDLLTKYIQQEINLGDAAKKLLAANKTLLKDPFSDSAKSKYIDAFVSFQLQIAKVNEKPFTVDQQSQMKKQLSEEFDVKYGKKTDLLARVKVSGDYARDSANDLMQPIYDKCLEVPFVPSGGGRRNYSPAENTRVAYFATPADCEKYIAILQENKAQELAIKKLKERIEKGESILGIYNNRNNDPYVEVAVSDESFVTRRPHSLPDGKIVNNEPKIYKVKYNISAAFRNSDVLDELRTRRYLLSKEFLNNFGEAEQFYNTIRSLESARESLSVISTVRKMQLNANLEHSVVNYIDGLTGSLERDIETTNADLRTFAEQKKGIIKIISLLESGKTFMQIYKDKKNYESENVPVAFDNPIVAAEYVKQSLMAQNASQESGKLVLSESALRIAEFYEDNGLLDEAAKSYGYVLTSYPGTQAWQIANEKLGHFSSLTLKMSYQRLRRIGQSMTTPGSLVLFIVPGAFLRVAKWVADGWVAARLANWIVIRPVIVDIEVIKGVGATSRTISKIKKFLSKPRLLFGRAAATSLSADESMAAFFKNIFVTYKKAKYTRWVSQGRLQAMLSESGVSADILSDLKAKGIVSEVAMEDVALLNSEIPQAIRYTTVGNQSVKVIEYADAVYYNFPNRILKIARTGENLNYATLSERAEKLKVAMDWLYKEGFVRKETADSVTALRDMLKDMRAANAATVTSDSEAVAAISEAFSSAQGVSFANSEMTSALLSFGVQPEEIMQIAAAARSAGAVSESTAIGMYRGAEISRTSIANSMGPAGQDLFFGNNDAAISLRQFLGYEFDAERGATALSSLSNVGSEILVEVRLASVINNNALVLSTPRILPDPDYAIIRAAIPAADQTSMTDLVAKIKSAYASNPQFAEVINKLSVQLRKPYGLAVDATNLQQGVFDTLDAATGAERIQTSLLGPGDTLKVSANQCSAGCVIPMWEKADSVLFRSGAADGGIASATRSNGRVLIAFSDPARVNGIVLNTTRDHFFGGQTSNMLTVDLAKVDGSPLIIPAERVSSAQGIILENSLGTTDTILQLPVAGSDLKSGELMLSRSRGILSIATTEIGKPFLLLFSKSNIAGLGTHGFVPPVPLADLEYVRANVGLFASEYSGQNEALSNIISDLRYGRISRDEAIAQLTAQGLTPTEAESLLERINAGAFCSNPRCYQLLVDGKPVIITENKPALTVGRDPANDLVISDMAVSRNHAVFNLDDTGVLRISDLGSSNGTYVKDAAGELVRVTPGDSVFVSNGESVVIAFSHEIKVSSFHAIPKRAAIAMQLPHYDLSVRGWSESWAVDPQHPVISVGRYPKNEIGAGVFDRTLSRNHSKFELQPDGSLVVIDTGTTGTGSLTGTFINGTRIPPNTPVRVYNGDEVTAGPLGISVSSNGISRPAGATIPAFFDAVTPENAAAEQAADAVVSSYKVEILGLPGNPSYEISRTKPSFTIGRDSSNDIILPDQTISRTHARLYLQPNGVLTITDIGTTGQGSLGGTFVNGSKIQPNRPVALNYGDMVEIGPYQIRIPGVAMAEPIVTPPPQAFQGITAADRFKISFGDQSVTLDNSTSTIGVGRDPGKQIILTSPYSSRNHCTFSYSNKQLYVVDTSSNGTYVNGVRINSNEAIPLNDGGVVEVPGLKFTIQAGGQAEVVSPGVQAAAASGELRLDRVVDRVFALVNDSSLEARLPRASISDFGLSGKKIFVPRTEDSLVAPENVVPPSDWIATMKRKLGSYFNPTYEYSIGNVKYHFSKPFFLGKTRITFVAWVEKEGTLYPRIFYNSNSQTMWRVMPYMKGTDWFAKALTGTEHDVDLPAEINAVLEGIVNESLPIDHFDYETIREFVPASPEVTASFNSQIKVTSNLFTESNSPPEIRTIIAEDAPDYSAVLYAYRGHNELYGNYAHIVMASVNRQYKYLFVVSETGRVHLGTVESFTLPEISTFGTPTTVNRIKYVLEPSVEYAQQISREYAGAQVGGERSPYVENNFPMQITFISEFLARMGR